MTKWRSKIIPHLMRQHNPMFCNIFTCLPRSPPSCPWTANLAVSGKVHDTEAPSRAAGTARLRGVSRCHRPSMLEKSNNPETDRGRGLQPHHSDHVSTKRLRYAERMMTKVYFQISSFHRALNRHLSRHPVNIQTPTSL